MAEQTVKCDLCGRKMREPPAQDGEPYLCSSCAQEEASRGNRKTVGAVVGVILAIGAVAVCGFGGLLLYILVEKNYLRLW